MNDKLLKMAAVVDELIEMAKKLRDEAGRTDKARDLSIVITDLETVSWRIVR